MKRTLLLGLLVLIQWAVLAFFSWPATFVTAILLGLIFYKIERFFSFGVIVGGVAWLLPLIWTLSRGEGVTRIAAGIFEIPHGLAWILYLIPLLFGALITGVGMQIGKYLRLSVSAVSLKEETQS
ncbi:MAG: hypothetical protein GXO76_00315 [Calditrichaeota bacterium]|nr:hypothetical protein [Calditrichota bacterium]